MNLTAVLGIISANVVFFVSVLLSLGGLGGFFDFNSALIVIGGTISATMICFPPRNVKRLIADLRAKVINKAAKNYARLIEDIVAIAKARRKGEAAFDQAVKSSTYPFLQDAASVLFWTDAEVSADEFRDLLETRAKTHFKDSFMSAKVCRTIARFPPSFGMMGTVLGLIALLSSLGNPDAKSQIGPAMAVALITTLYGIAINNLIVIPLGENMALQSEDDLKIYEIVIEGVMLIQEGKPTKYIEEKLNSFIMPEQRSQVQAA